MRAKEVVLAEERAKAQEAFASTCETTIPVPEVTLARTAMIEKSCVLLGAKSSSRSTLPIKLRQRVLPQTQAALAPFRGLLDGKRKAQQAEKRRQERELASAEQVKERKKRQAAEDADRRKAAADGSDDEYESSSEDDSDSEQEQMR